MIFKQKKDKEKELNKKKKKKKEYQLMLEKLIMHLRKINQNIQKW